MSRLHLWSFPLCILCTMCRTGGHGCQPAPGLPCALCRSGGPEGDAPLGDSRRENADVHPHHCLTIESELAESELARRSLQRSDDGRFTDADPEGFAFVYSRAGVLTKSYCGNLVAALC